MKKIFLLITGILLLYPFLLNAQNDGSRYAAGSVLSQGKWVQIKTTENAIYKLSYDDIKKMGFSDPAKTKIYGYGGWILDQDFTKPYIDDLPEVSVWINKGSDNVFGSGDYLLFYGRGTVKWEYDASSDFFQHENNPYSLYGIYFITESDEGHKEISTKEETVSANPLLLTAFNDYYVHEKDEINVLESGRELFGESFSQTRAQSFSVTARGITSDAGKGKLYFIGAPSRQSSVSLSVDGTKVYSGSVSSPGSSSTTKATKAEGIGAWNADKKESFTVNIVYEGDGSAYLNYFLLNYDRKLQYYSEAFTFFRHKASRTQDVKYEIDLASSDLMVWDISGNFDTYLVNTSLSGNKCSFTAAADADLREYALIDPSGSFATPELIKEIKNQDLHSLESKDMIIISPSAYYSYANTLAEAHEKEGLSVYVAQPEWIYNEFSSGTRDASAYRRFLKMFYDRAETEENKPRYLLLFGDGVFDNRHLTKTGAQIDPALYLLTYQYENSINESSSYGTDDYFGFLDDYEGITLDKDSIDIGIGRFPISSVEQARNAVEKVLKYMQNSNNGEWKNKVLLAADNTDYYTTSGYCIHARDIDKLAERMENEHPEYMLYKSYMDAYKPYDANGKTTIPDAKNKFVNTLKEGCFVMTYLGHGSTRALSGEDMINLSDIRQMQFENLPVWVTGTCDFAWFDGFKTSAGEEVFLNKNSAGIALFSTTRLVYSDPNYELIDAFFTYMFQTDDNGERFRLGDIMRYAKNNIKTESFRANKLNFILLGDPALKLNYPQYKVQLEKINGEYVDDVDESGNPLRFNFRALDRVELEGYITDESGNPLSDFNGNIRTTVFDSKQTIKSYHTNVAGDHFTFSDYPNRVYVGGNNVENGRFKVSFMVPLDISYTDDLGKLNFYAVDSQTGIEANGWYKNFVFAGSSDNPPTGTDGPEIVEMFLNDPSFKDGDTVNDTPYFVATVYDENGINMGGSGLGHDIMISINNSPTTTYSLNSYYYPEDDGSGVVRFSIPSLPNGEHSLVFRVWDVLNNFSTDSLYFKVDKKLEPEVYTLIATNNPARTTTQFLLEHNRPESKLEIGIYVYDITGRAVWHHSEAGSSGWLKYYPIEWDLNDNRGGRVNPGIYIYKAIISAPEGKTATKAKKLIVLGQ